ncbi:hypothetical protein SDC9_180809 [bioreactor metagenome]|uniref:Uncharacterized protein n=1 Tax=bioreactor metagenome TaxID=1076179 RepID=A0A645HB46_9ZZZZ
MFTSIDMRSESSTFFFNFSILGERKNLKTTTICKNWFIPTVEFMQTTGTLKRINTRPQIQMIGISQNDLSLNILFQLMKMNGLD